MSELPVHRQQALDNAGLFTLPWRKWLESVNAAVNSNGTDTSSLSASISAIAMALGSPDGTVENIPDQDSLSVTITNGAGILVTGKAGQSPVVIALAPVDDEGGGTFKLLTRDDYGRISGSSDGNAADVPYDNATSGLTATDAQAAIDETVGLIPATTDDLPEGSTNLYFHDAPSDGSTYGRKNGVWSIAAGSGDVVGPASSTDSHVALFDGTTGKALKDGGALATIATTGDVGDLTGFPGGTSDFLRADGSFATPSGSSSTAWTLVKSWDFAVSGAVASIDESVAGYNEVMVVVTDVTLAAAGYRAVQVSANGGTSYPTSYDYITNTGVRATNAAAYMQVHNTTTTAARCGTAQFQLVAAAEVLFTGNQMLNSSSNVFMLPAFGTKPNRVKVGGWTAAGATTNMTGGKVFIYAR